MKEHGSPFDPTKLSDFVRPRVDSPSTLQDLAPLLEYFAAPRDEILRLPSVEEGLNMTRIHRFRERMNIPKKEIRVLTPSDFDRVREIIGYTSHTQGEHSGVYLASLGIIVVKRDPDLEALNGGPRFIEALIAHEIGHSDIQPPEVEISLVTSRIRKMKQIILGDTLRQGFIRKNATGELEGIALEEAYAELLRGMYVTEELGMEVGFGGRLRPDDAPYPGDKYTMFQRKDTEVVPIVPPGAIPAVALELLIARDPNLFSVLQAARYSDDLDELHQYIRTINPKTVDILLGNELITMFEPE